MNFTKLEDSDATIAASIIFTLGLIGICVNICAIAVVVQRRLLRNPFGILCLAHEIPDVIILASFTVFCAPVTFLQVTTDRAVEFSKVVGHIDFIAWNVTVYSHVLIAVNRFTAIYFPVTYRNYFKPKVTLILVMCCVILAFAQTTPLFFEGCYLFYISDVYLWAFSQTPCGSVLQNSDMTLGITLMTTVMCIDMCTYWKIKSTMRAFNNGNHVRADDSQKNQDIRFFMQALVQAVVYILKKLCFYVFSRFASGKWSLFFTTFFAWMMCHVLDGLILIAYNYRKDNKTGPITTTNQSIR